MGSAIALDHSPHFEVRASGSLEQLPGCPDFSTGALEPERIERLCGGECYNPSDRRRPITRIEVVRIRPQQHAGEPLETLIEDPWRSFDCPPDPSGCTIAFDDPSFADGRRDAVYYVRAIEAPTPAVNGAQLRCERESREPCERSRPCNAWSPDSEDCLAAIEERAWSSPIFVDWAGR